MTLTQKTLSQALATWLDDNGYSSDDLNQPGENGDSALMKLTRTGHLEWMQELLAVGVDINVCNHDGNNALWFACFGNFDQAIDLLVEAGIDIDNQNDNGATADSTGMSSQDTWLATISTGRSRGTVPSIWRRMPSRRQT